MNSMSKWFENVRVALTALLANKFRAALTTIGIGIGIAAVVILVSLGQAVQAYVTRQFLGVGADLIYVRQFISNNTQGPATGRSGISLSSLTEKDVALLQDPFNVPNVKAVVPIVTLTRPTEYGPNQFQVRVTGATAPYFDVVDRQVASGRLFDEQDTLSSARVACSVRPPSRICLRMCLRLVRRSASAGSRSGSSARCKSPGAAASALTQTT